VSGRELLLQLAILNENCRKAILEEDFQRLKALMQLKKEIIPLIKKVSFSPEDVSDIQKILKEEEELASLALSKKENLEKRLAASVFH